MSDTQPPPDEPQKVGDERTMLAGWLDYHRAVLRRKCAGLDDEQLRRRSCKPSNLSLLGLVCHLTDVERGWFLRGVASRASREVPPLHYSDEDPEGDFDNVDAADTRAVFAAYEQAIADIRAATAPADADLDRTFDNGGSPCSVRWVYQHIVKIRASQRPRRPAAGTHRRHHRLGLSGFCRYRLFAPGQIFSFRDSDAIRVPFSFAMPSTMNCRH